MWRILYKIANGVYLPASNPHPHFWAGKVEGQGIFYYLFGIFWNLLESFGIFWNLLESFGIFWIFWNLLETFGIFEQLGWPRTRDFSELLSSAWSILGALGLESISSLVTMYLWIERRKPCKFNSDTKFTISGGEGNFKVFASILTRYFLFGSPKI